MIEAVNIVVKEITTTIEKREEVYKNRSDAWRERYKGENYKLQTEVLKSILIEQQGVLDALLDWKEEL